MTPYGPPSPYAYIIPVPNDCVGLIIGKGGETIRMLQQQTGAKIQVAKKEIEKDNLRNVFVEGPPEQYQKAKDLIDQIIRENRKGPDQMIHIGERNPFPGPHFKMPIPCKMVGQIIGKNGDTLRGIAHRSNAKIFIQKDCPENIGEDRVVEISGDHLSIEAAKQEIMSLTGHVSGAGVSYYENPYQ